MNPQSSSPKPKSPLRVFRQVLPHLVLLPSVAFLLSAVMTLATVGFGDGFFPRWARSFGICLLALPLVLIFVGILEKQVDKIFGSMPWVARKLVVALLAACVIETVLALATTLINNPWDSTVGQFWWIAFSRSLPFGIFIGLFMCFYMKPKMDRMAKAARAG